MKASGLAPVEKSAHVPDELVFDVNIYTVFDGEGDVHEAWKAVQAKYPPLFWTPHNGGHWIATRGEDIQHMIAAHQQFSNNHVHVPKGITPLILPVQLDPPEHGPFRRLLMPAFLPKAVAEVEKRARATAIEIIEKLKPTGQCEFVSDFAGAMPIIAFLSMLNLPAEDAPMLRGYISLMMPAINPRAPEGWAALTKYIAGWIVKRRAEPGDDLISRIVQGEVDGRPLTDAEILSMCQTLLGGGLDTVVTMTSFIAHFLATHPEERRLLREEPARISGSIEEFARRFSVVQLGREVREDMEYSGVRLAKGDMVVLPTALHGLDDTINEDPMKVDLDRKRPRHQAFGGGPHNCIGAVLARREMMIFLEEWLPRIPDFRIKEGTTPHITTGLTNSMADLMLEWDV